MKKTHKVVMLPTEKASQISTYKRPSYNGRLMEFAPEPTPTDKDWQKQQLYIISDDEIKEGDYYKTDAGIFKCSGCESASELSNFNKIVATTDKDLGTNQKEPYDTSKPYWKELPQIPESFIQAFIKAYNEGKPITEVDLEMIKDTMGCHDESCSGNPCRNYKIKTRPDNTVIIVESKMYTKDEVRKLLIKYSFDMKLNPIGGPKFDNWIQDNL